jgi:hypothetical protein
MVVTLVRGEKSMDVTFEWAKKRLSMVVTLVKELRLMHLESLAPAKKPGPMTVTDSNPVNSNVAALTLEKSLPDTVVGREGPQTYCI